MKLLTALVVALLILLPMAAYGALHTDLGVFLVGYRYWMTRAAWAETEEATDAHLRRVLAGTQYGVDQAQNWTRAHTDRGRRIKLWRRLIEPAPNDGWRLYYSLDLEKDLAQSEGTG